MADLPKFFALKSAKNQKYVVFKDQSTAELPNRLECSGEESHSKYARFKAEKDVNQPSLVHIKSTYSDKYLRTASEDSPWIVAEADEKQPNKNLWSCTLFKPVVLQKPAPYVDGVYQFVHVRLGNLTEPKSGTDFEDDALAAENEKPTSTPAFTVEKLPG
ncbi:hypothetical protein PRUPE_3G153100 [Prunus persica]|uniref:Uncharacterized protein n=1 Tax=Prunus persica TaxID=3760 RepID=M5WR60_PRUPE|nr:uncharacterized protein LOC18783155 [Prunus persica]ONI17349.1 hypothetical protein PRUPE_3G153100 [Prunus persica]